MRVENLYCVYQYFKSPHWVPEYRQDTPLHVRVCCFGWFRLHVLTQSSVNPTHMFVIKLNALFGISACSTYPCCNCSTLLNNKRSNRFMRSRSLRSAVRKLALAGDFSISLGMIYLCLAILFQSPSNYTALRLKCGTGLTIYSFPTWKILGYLSQTLFVTEGSQYL